MSLLHGSGGNASGFKVSGAPKVLVYSHGLRKSLLMDGTKIMENCILRA